MQKQNCAEGKRQESCISCISNKLIYHHVFLESDAMGIDRLRCSHFNYVRLRAPDSQDL